MPPHRNASSSIVIRRHLRPAPTLAFAHWFVLFGCLNCLHFTGSLLAESASHAAARQRYESALAAAEVPGQADSPESASAFDLAVAARAALDGRGDFEARIAVYRDLGAKALASRRAADAVGIYTRALELTTSAGDASLLLEFSLSRAMASLAMGDRLIALADATTAARLAEQLGRTSEQIEALLIAAECEALRSNWEKAGLIYRQLLTLPGADTYRILRQEADHAILTDHAKAERIPMLSRLLAAAEASGQATRRAEVHDLLGIARYQQGDLAGAIREFRAADQLPVDQSTRRGRTWLYYSRALRQTGNFATALPMLQQAATRAAQVEDKWAPDLFVELAAADAETGDHAAAYRHLSRARELEARQAALGQKFPQSALTVSLEPEILKEAAMLAAVRNSLRESELAAARIEQRQLVLGAVAVIIIAGLLGVAYVFKRRAAAALALARDAAELRAERTHWQMLRYQLSPHFLFNALASLSGLVATDPPAARRVVGRLADFCRLALERTSGDLRTVGEEVALLSAFLDVEQAGAGDQLACRFDIDPAATGRLLPPLLLQPLVENALKYGGQTATGRLELVVTARPEGAGIFIEVANTGSWVEPTAGNRRHGGIGLANVRERLARLGAAPDALVTAAEPGWVRVSVRLPDLARFQIQAPAMAV